MRPHCSVECKRAFANREKGEQSHEISPVLCEEKRQLLRTSQLLNVKITPLRGVIFILKLRGQSVNIQTTCDTQPLWYTKFTALLLACFNKFQPLLPADNLNMIFMIATPTAGVLYSSCCLSIYFTPFHCYCYIRLLNLMLKSERNEEQLLKSFIMLDNANDNISDSFSDDGGGRKNSRSLSQYSQYTDPDAPLEYVSLNDSSTFSCYINLLNTIIGSGVLGLPYAVGYCGVVLGVVLILVFGALNIFSCHLLTVCAGQFVFVVCMLCVCVCLCFLSLLLTISM